MKLNKLSRSGAFMNYTAKDISKYNHANQILSNRTIQPIPTPSNTQSITFMPKMSHTNWSVCFSLQLIFQEILIKENKKIIFFCILKGARFVFATTKFGQKGRKIGKRY